MELHQLRTFVAVAEEGHLTRAAERLFVSQPAVSAHIKALEGELGVTLFHRTPRGMTLTREGERLAGRARRILEDAQSLLGEAQGMSGALSGSFSLGLNTDSAFLRIGDIFARIRGNYPGISLSLANSSSRNIVRDVRRGTLDAGFAYGDVSGDGVQADPLTEVPFHVVGPVQWAQRLDGADWAALADMPWIWMAENCPFLEVLDRRFAPLGVEPRKCTEGDHEDILRALVIAGEGLTLMRSDEAADAQERGLLAVWPGDPLHMTLSLVRRESRQDEPVLQAVRDVILAVWG
jgi:DNA-binding transcriptional LysR family regulator